MQNTFRHSFGHSLKKIIYLFKTVKNYSVTNIFKITKKFGKSGNITILDTIEKYKNIYSAKRQNI